MDKILATVAHRPWPLPHGPWVMRQSWSDLLFAHWPIRAAEMAALLPPGLTLDTFDGWAWVGVVPFRMHDVYPRGTFAVPWLSAFPELNVRTYVTAGNGAAAKAGVYFFSLDAGNPVAVALARRLYHLPYFRAGMAVTDIGGGDVQYRSRRTHRAAPRAEFMAEYGPTGAPYLAQRGTLEWWLTERYCLYTTNSRGLLLRGEIHHVPWPLQPAEATIRVNSMAAAAGLVTVGEAPLLHFVQRIDVAVWPTVRVEVAPGM